MTFVPRLKAGIFVRALIRRAEVAGASAFIVRKGAEEAGAVIITVSRLDKSCLLLNQARDGKGALVWARSSEERSMPACDGPSSVDAMK